MGSGPSIRCVATLEKTTQDNVSVPARGSEQRCSGGSADWREGRAHFFGEWGIAPISWTQMSVYVDMMSQPIGTPPTLRNPFPSVGFPTVGLSSVDERESARAQARSEAFGETQPSVECIR